MRYVILLRYGLWDFRTVMTVSRSDTDGIACNEGRVPPAGMMWRPDGRYRVVAENGIEHDSFRRPLVTISQPLVAYSIPGPKLLDEGIPRYARDGDIGATVQISGHAVLEEPDRVALQLILVPRGEQPYHRETVGDRRFDEGQPDMWIVLDRLGGEPSPRVAVAHPVPRAWPPLKAEEHQ